MRSALGGLVAGAVLGALIGLIAVGLGRLAINPDAARWSSGS